VRGPIPQNGFSSIRSVIQASEVSALQFPAKSELQITVRMCMKGNCNSGKANFDTKEENSILWKLKLNLSDRDLVRHSAQQMLDWN